jgi:hypothetical protein
MSETIQVEHGLSLEEARARLEALAQRHDVVLVADGGDGRSGTLEKGMGFLGTVRGRFVIEATRVEVAILSAPALVGPQALQRMLGEALEEAFRS